MIQISIIFFTIFIFIHLWSLFNKKKKSPTWSNKIAFYCHFEPFDDSNTTQKTKGLSLKIWSPNAP